MAAAYPTQASCHPTPLPFFNMQPPQPYLPHQWTMPYSPYCGLPAMGYGMIPQIPPSPPHPYVDGQSYIMPRTPFHLVDYRKMINPHMAPAMAYQARRFCYHRVTSHRVMVSSAVLTKSIQVQNTSPISSFSNDGPITPANSESRRNTCCTTSASTSTSSGSSTEVRTCDCSEPVVVPAPQQPTSSIFVGDSMPKAILSQAEEVQIKCNGTVADLQMAHTEKTTKLVSDPSGLLHCATGAPGVTLEGTVQSPFPQLQPEKLREGDDVRRDPTVDEIVASSEKNCLQPCPDIHLTRGLSSASPGESLPSTLEGSLKRAGTPNANVVNTNSADQTENVSEVRDRSVNVCADAKMVFQDEPNGEPDKVDHDLNSKTPQCKVMHRLMFYVSNREWLIQNGQLTPQNSLLTHQKEAVSPVIENSMSPAVGDHADFGLYHKVESNVQQQLCSHVKGGLHMSQSSETLPLRFVEKTGRHGQRIAVGDVSDQECQPTSSYLPIEGLLFPSPCNRQCVCWSTIRCGGDATSSTPSLRCLRHPNSQHQDHAKSPGCGTSKCVPGGRAKSSKESGSNISGHLKYEDITEKESSENNLGPILGVKMASAQKLLHVGSDPDECLIP